VFIFLTGHYWCNSKLTYLVLQIAVDVHDDAEVGEVVAPAYRVVGGVLDRVAPVRTPVLQRVTPETASWF
jgi:hypothetical protein